MTWLSQLILLALLAGVFVLLLRSYRKQNAMEESFLCSILLMGAACVAPEVVVFFPVVWWAFHLLWADGLRVYLASMLGILFFLLYAALVYFFYPDWWVVGYVRSQIDVLLIRSVCFWPGQMVAPIEYLTVTGLFSLLGIWALIAHLLKYSRANVRVQTRVLLTIPFLLLSVVSCIFPSAGNCLLLPLVALAMYLAVIYVKVYGFPRFKRKQHRSNRHKRRKMKRPVKYYY